MDGLRTLTPDVRSFLKDPFGWEVRQHWQRYWLVDPLDGTKEFIKRNGNSPLTLRSLTMANRFWRGVCAGNERNVQRGKGKSVEKCGVRKRIQVRDARRRWW